MVPETTLPDRQKELEKIITDALQDPDLLEALEAFQLSESEYARAITGSENIKIFSSNAANLGNNTNAGLD